MADRFETLRYKVHTSDHIDKDFPELFRSAEFKKLRLRPDYQKLIKYIVFLYDKGTPLTNEYQSDLRARKDAAAIEAGYQKIDGKWSDDLQKMMDAQDQDGVAAIMQFLKVQRNNVWIEINVTEQELYEFQTLRFAAIASPGKTKGKKAAPGKEIYEAANKKDSLKEACDSRIKYLEGLYVQFYGDNKDIQEAEFSEMITPENAERLLEGTKPWKEVDEVAAVQPIAANVS